MKTLEKIVVTSAVALSSLFFSGRSEAFSDKLFGPQQIRQEAVNTEHDYSYQQKNLGDSTRLRVSLFTDENLRDYLTLSVINLAKGKSFSCRTSVEEIRINSRLSYRASLDSRVFEVFFEGFDPRILGDEKILHLLEYDYDEHGVNTDVHRFSVNSLYMMRFMDVINQRNSILDYYTTYQPTFLGDDYGSVAFWPKDFVNEAVCEAEKKAVISLDLTTNKFFRYFLGEFAFDNGLVQEPESGESRGLLRVQELKPVAVTYLGPKYDGSRSTPFSLDGKNYQLAYSVNDGLWRINQIK